MQKTLLIIFGAFVLLALPLNVRAGDGDKPEKAKADEKAEKEKAKEEKKVAREEYVERESEHKGGNTFTRFWTHTVGDTIGSGLKHGTHKVTKAFGSDD